jgi:hypothetical protein
MPVDECLPALYLGERHPRTGIAKLIQSKQISDFVALAWAPPSTAVFSSTPPSSLATLVDLGGCCSDTELSEPLGAPYIP